MAVKLNTKFLEGFIDENEYKACAHQVTAAHKVLTEKNGEGNDMDNYTAIAVYEKGKSVLGKWL